MANNAVYTQLPIMVKRPQAVWPGLDQMDLHRNVIAGDGNSAPSSTCLIPY